MDEIYPYWTSSSLSSYSPL